MFFTPHMCLSLFVLKATDVLYFFNNFFDHPMFRKQSEKATCRPKRLIAGQGGERRSCGQEGTTGGVFLGIQDGIVEGDLLVMGGGGGKSRMTDAE